MLALRRALNDPRRRQDVVGHRLIFCKAAQSMPTENLLLSCWFCGRFLVYCCGCTERRHLDRGQHLPTPEDDDQPEVCHYYKMAFVDGACLGNGQKSATAGIGIAIGVVPKGMHWAIPVDDSIDPSAVRTSQRAELLAAIHGIHKLAECEDEFCTSREAHRDLSDKITWVITSDSEYVVLGMTEWVPAWKDNGWRNSGRRRPKNLDLFQKLDAVVEHYERQNNVCIAFWHISRVHNKLADKLAGFAAQGHTPAGSV